MADDLQVISGGLPANPVDLSKFVMVNRERLVAMQAELRAIDKVGVAEEIRRQKLAEAQDVADALLAAEVRLGELISELPESQGKRTDLELEDSGVQKSKKEVLEDMGLSVKTAQRYERLASHPEIVASISAESRDKGEIVSRTSVLRAIKQAEKTTEEKPEKKAPVMPAYEGEEEDERCVELKYRKSARYVFYRPPLDPAAASVGKGFGASLISYTKSANGLSKDWGRASIWLFPPYYDTNRFVKKLLASVYGEAIVLVNNETETKWFQALWERASAVLFHAGKMKFKYPEGKGYTGPECGMVFFYLGDRPDRFLDEFSKYGVGTKLREFDAAIAEIEKKRFENLGIETDERGCPIMYNGEDDSDGTELAAEETEAVDEQE